MDHVGLRYFHVCTEAVLQEVTSRIQQIVQDEEDSVDRGGDVQVVGWESFFSLREHSGTALVLAGWLQVHRTHV